MKPGAKPTPVKANLDHGAQGILLGCWKQSVQAVEGLVGSLAHAVLLVQLKHNLPIPVRLGARTMSQSNIKGVST